MPRKKKLPPRGTYVSLGDCYEAAGKFIMDQSMLHMGPRRRVAGELADAEGLMLVHAEVAGQGPMDGKTFGHAFVVDTVNSIVIDQSNNRDIRLPAGLYYSIAQIYEIDNYYEYTPEQMVKNMIKTKHWGPWDLKTRSGL